MVTPASPSLIEHFAALRDPRQSWKVIYPLEEVLLLVLCATLAGAEDFVDVRRWGGVNQDFLRRFLPYGAGIASHGTLNDVINAIGGDLFAQCFSDWVEGLREAEPDIVASDGKTSRRTMTAASSADRSIWSRPGPAGSCACRRGLVSGQQACEAKSNEITAIPLLLERLALTGALVTIDAMGCQTKIAQAILDKGGDYLLAVKDNQPSLHDEIARYFDDTAGAARDCFGTTDGEHGRIEVRRHFVSHEVGWLTTDRRFAGLQAISMVEAETWRKGKTSRERRYYLCSTPMDARLFARAMRCHWHIEKPSALGARRGLPRRPQPPQVRRRTAEHGDRRHMAMNLIRSAKDKHSLKVRRKSAAWDTAYLEGIIRQTA